MVGRALLILVAVLGCAATSVLGTETTYSARPAFQSAVGSSRKYSFDTADGFPAAPAPISSVDNGFLQFSSGGGPASIDSQLLLGNNQVLTGRASNQVNRSVPFSIVPSFGQTAIGFDIYNLGPAETASIVVSDNSDRPPVVYHVRDNDFVPETPVFFGFIWTQGINSVDIWASNDLCVGPAICYTPNFIDNLTVAVPEPAALALLVCGSWIFTRRIRAISARG